MHRLPWEKDFPPTLVNCAWAMPANNERCLKFHPLYQAAKGQRDVGAAIEILDEVVTERTIVSLRQIETSIGEKPTLVAPATQIGDSNNALAITYAQWLSAELEWPVELRVFQIKAFSKDRSGPWVRIANRSTFYGQIDKGRPYVIVDDVLTLGGTIADLRAFIMHKGGSVIGSSVIASQDGRDRNIGLDGPTIDGLERQYGSDLEAFCIKLLGFGHRCLTAPEAGAFAGCSGYVDLRKKIAGGLDAANAQRGKVFVRR